MNDASVAIADAGGGITLRRRPRPPLWLLAMLTFTGTLAMHIFVPALPIAAADLGAGFSAMQMTISLYILGLAIGQIIYGPVSDRFGRRPALMAGLAIYVAAERRLPYGARRERPHRRPAVPGARRQRRPRARARDRARHVRNRDAARRLALMNLMVTLGPALAPLLGGLLAGAAGWRSIFVLLCMLGVVNFVLTWRLLPETSAPSRHANAALVRNYGQLLGSPAFLGFAVGGGCATTSMYAFIAAAPFIFVHELHRPVGEVGPYLAMLIVGVWFGSLAASRLLRFVPIRRLLIASNGLSVIAAFGLLAAVLTGHLSVALAVGAMFLFTFGAGTAAPVALTEAISVNPKVIGSASGLYGFSQMTIGAVCTALAGLGQSPGLAAALVLAGAGIVAQIAFWIAFRSSVGRGR